MKTNLLRISAITVLTTAAAFAGHSTPLTAGSEFDKQGTRFQVVISQKEDSQKEDSRKKEAVSLEDQRVRSAEPSLLANGNCETCTPKQPPLPWYLLLAVLWPA